MKRILIIMMVLMVSVIYAHAALGDDITAYYKLEDMSDELGLVNLTDSGTSSQPGLINNARYFDGGTDYISFPTDPFAIRSQDFTISVWFNTSDTGSTYILDNDDGGSPDYRLFIRQEVTTNLIRFFADVGATSASLFSTQTYNDGNWHHIVITRSGDNATMYIDGVLEDSSLGFTGDIDEATTAWYFGTQNFGGNWEGHIDESGFWVGKALSSSEVSQLYNSGIGTTYPFGAISSNIESKYSFENFSITLNTTAATNMSYVLDEDSEIFLCESCTGYLLDLVNISDGSHNITFISDDGVSQVNSSHSFLVDPLQYFTFQDSDSVNVSNFTLNGVFFSSTPANLSVNDYGLGPQVLTFEKDGYSTTQFNITFTITSTYDEIYSVPGSLISINIYDRDTEALITDLVDLQLIATVGANTTTTTGQANFSRVDFVNETYKVVASSADYEAEEINFEFSNKEVTTHSIYMVKSNSTSLGTITLIVKDSRFTFLEGALCQALEWKPAQSAFISVAQATTNVNGECTLNIELEDKVYEFQVSKENYITELTASERIYASEETRTLILEDVIVTGKSFLERYDLSVTETISGNETTINFYSNNYDNDQYTACLTSYSVIAGTKTQLTEDCVTATTVDLEITYNTNNSYALLVEATIDDAFSITSIDTFIYSAVANIDRFLTGLNLLKVIPLMVILFSVGISLTRAFELGLGLIIIGTWLMVPAFPGLISGVMASFTTVIVGIILYLTFRRRSN